MHRQAIPRGQVAYEPNSLGGGCPFQAGAAAGFLAGAIGAALYATHCPDDSPLFVAAWYSLAIGFVAALGAVAGSRLLRW